MKSSAVILASLGLFWACLANPGHAAENAAAAPQPPAQAQPEPASPGFHSIPFTLSARFFQKGDSLSIGDVSATSPNLRPGDRVTVKGHYTLGSKAQAMLYLGVTATEGSGKSPIRAEQRQMLQRGVGEFELTTTINSVGCPHVSFYSTAGHPIGKLYFGTPEQAQRSKHWDVRRWCAQN